MGIPVLAYHHWIALENPASLRAAQEHLSCISGQAKVVSAVGPSRRNSAHSTRISQPHLAQSMSSVIDSGITTMPALIMTGATHVLDVPDALGDACGDCGGDQCLEVRNLELRNFGTPEPTLT